METLLRRRRKELSLKHYQKAYHRLHATVEYLYREGATAVFTFGSITAPEKFTEHSDIDIAVRGIDEDKHLMIEGRIADFLEDIEYDIIFLEEVGVRTEILEKIRKEAILWSR